MLFCKASLSRRALSLWSITEDLRKSLENKFFCIMERDVTPDDGGGAEAELEPAEEQVSAWAAESHRLAGGRLLGSSRARTPRKPQLMN